MNGKHTPGPWEIDKYDKVDRGWPIMNGGQGMDEYMVAFVPCWVRRPEEYRANAALIAAAPDLLAALKASRVEGTLAQTHTRGECQDLADRVFGQMKGGYYDRA